MVELSELSAEQLAKLKKLGQVRSWRRRNRDRYNEYQRLYMQRRKLKLKSLASLGPTNSDTHLINGI